MQFIRNIVDGVRFDLAFDAIVRRWRKLGVPAPRFIAAREVSMRALLEGFRDYASAEFLERNEARLEVIKQQWLATKFKSLTAATGAESAGMLRAAVEVMPPSEAFTPRAYVAWCSYADTLMVKPRGNTGHGLMNWIKALG